MARLYTSSIEKAGTAKQGLTRFDAMNYTKPLCRCWKNRDPLKISRIELGCFQELIKPASTTAGNPVRLATRKIASSTQQSNRRARTHSYATGAGAAPEMSVQVIDVFFRDRADEA
jgi:hypothetical protein